MAMPMEPHTKRFAHEQIKKIHKIFVDGNTTGLSIKNLLDKSRLEFSVVRPLLNRLLERQWMYRKNGIYRLSHEGKQRLEEMLDKNEEYHYLPILSS